MEHVSLCCSYQVDVEFGEVVAEINKYRCMEDALVLAQGSVI